ncbi:MAG: response regulator transcription factor [Thermodesulfovibrionales bacterium]|nr:response regulator transcription factor [Thermodesulfovibrionales bacterium]
MIRVLIADDHSLVREGIIAFLKICDDIEVIGEASDGLEAVEKTENLKPDIVLLDINMPKLGGLEATLEIKRKLPDVKILILTQYDDREYIARLLRAGVSGYILKRAAGSELVNAIRAVKRGELYLHPSIAKEIVQGYLNKEKAPQEDSYEKLTEREKQVLKLISEGYTYKEIADMLGISVKTAIAHHTKISEKLNIHTRAGLIKFAIQKGIIKLDELNT